jgi:hypothetical protein
MADTVDVVQKLIRHNGSSPLEKFVFQVKLLLWKRYCESTKSKLDLFKVVFPALLFFVLLILIYEVFTFFSPDGIEAFFVPFAFWIFIQRIVVQIMYEKSSRLQESMRMMGLSDSAYWTSYFISDGVILGFILSFLCTILTVGGLFNGANFGVILGLLYCFCLSAVPFAFFLCSFFDTPQTSGQATLGILFGEVLYLFMCSKFHIECYSFRFLRFVCGGFCGGQSDDPTARRRGDLLSVSATGSPDRIGRIPQLLHWNRSQQHLRYYGEIICSLLCKLKD